MIWLIENKHDNSANMFIKSSYSKDDVIFLLKDIGELIKEQNNEQREQAIQSGIHYSEMLPIEYKPSEKYMDIFYKGLKQNRNKIAVAVGVVAERILALRGEDLVFVSLARAGSPAGILLKRYLKYKYDIDIPHYSISIIRGKGIDENSIKYILRKHPNRQIQFIDGWTGKGAITNELSKACKNFNEKYLTNIDDRLAVIADPAHCTTIYGTREDFLIPSACLNSTVSGLVSRTVHRKDLIGEDDFHGAKFYEELIDEDVSNLFIDTIAEQFKYIDDKVACGIKEIESNEYNLKTTWIGLKDVQRLQSEFDIQNINFIKPGVGETTRVLLRRVPWKILIKEESASLEHIIQLAKERNVPVEKYDLLAYECCGLIKSLRRE
ncbi:cysteine protease StiP family protein [Abyssisolibacter fermentans]|uniref:cysteine protease StiP family protein n=1 Tax=Abyssisolibacter fermentans TaxID=1766203 RepID=UPI0030841342